MENIYLNRDGKFYLMSCSNLEIANQQKQELEQKYNIKIEISNKRGIEYKSNPKAIILSISTYRGIASYATHWYGTVKFVSEDELNRFRLNSYPQFIVQKEIQLKRLVNENDVKKYPHIWNESQINNEFFQVEGFNNVDEMIRMTKELKTNNLPFYITDFNRNKLDIVNDNYIIEFFFSLNSDGEDGNELNLEYKRIDSHQIADHNFNYMIFNHISSVLEMCFND